MNKRLIVGLGNPGDEYTWTRHNIGFLVVQRLAEKWQSPLRKVKGIPALFAEWEQQDIGGLLAQPSTYMNKSGIAVKHLLRQEHIDLNHMLIICDDFHLPFGRLRLRKRGSSGGQNGLKSIIETIGTQDFARLRIGIGQPKDPSQAADFVLQSFNKKEKEELGFIVEEACDCCEAWLSLGTDEAMNQFNQKGAS